MRFVNHRHQARAVAPENQEDSPVTLKGSLRYVPQRPFQGDRRRLLQAPLDRAIMQVMDGSNNAASTEYARRAVAALRRRGVDGIILGCTEIPLLLETDLDDADLLNPGALLAEAAVRCAIA